MAVTNIERVKITDANELSSAITFTAASSAADGFKVNFEGKDYKTLIIVEGGSTEGTITVKQGNGIQGVADITYAVGASATFALTLDSGVFKNVSGDNKGHVMIVPSTTAIKIAAVELP